MRDKTSLIQPEQIEQVILLIRGQRVMLDRDLAALYGVETKKLNKAVRRNLDRFPADFMFQLTLDEAEACAPSRFQFGTLKRGQNIKYLPQVFTQEGVAMLSSVLRSPRAVQVNIAIMRVFVRLRGTLALHKELAHKLAEPERKIEGHDTSIRTLFDARSCNVPAEPHYHSMRTATFGSAGVLNLSWPANLITAFAARLLPLLLLLILPGVVRGQFTRFVYTITDGTATIIMYTGGDGEVVIPGTLDGLPVTAIGGYNGYQGFWTGAFEGRSGVTGVTIPNSVTTIGSRAFNSCLSLTSVTIPNSVISIESGSFAYCYSLTNVTIPDSVSSIGVGAFFESGLTTVYFRGNCPTPSDNLFQDASMAIVYYLPGTAGWAATLAGRPTALWVLPYPLILTSSVGFGPQSNRFGFRISWTTNLSVVVETATGVLGSNWAQISTNALINGWADFSDPKWTNYPSRFYRIRSP